MSNSPVISRTSQQRTHPSITPTARHGPGTLRREKLCVIDSRRLNGVARTSAVKEGKTVRRIIAIVCAVVMLLAATASNTLALDPTAGHGDGGVTAGHGDGGGTV